jgi:hypothetical protein
MDLDLVCDAFCAEAGAVGSMRLAVAAAPASRPTLWIKSRRSILSFIMILLCGVQGSLESQFPSQATLNNPALPPVMTTILLVKRIIQCLLLRVGFGAASCVSSQAFFELTSALRGLSEFGPTLKPTTRRSWSGPLRQPSK